MQPNKLIRLFQQKADNALGMYVTLREKCVGQPMGQWSQSDLIMAAGLKATMETWAKAAELLRKEELQR